MRFYRVSLFRPGDESDGFAWETSRVRAEAIAQDNAAVAADWDAEMVSVPAVDPVDIEPTRAGILRALRRYGAHADNG